MKKYLLFDEVEYRARDTKAREYMDKAGLDVCVFTKDTDLIYFSGYLTYIYNSDFRPLIYVLPKVGDPVLIVPALEYGGACKTSWVSDVRIWGGKKAGTPMDPIELLADVIKEKGLEQSRAGFEFSNGVRLGMTVAQYRQLIGLLPDIKPLDNSDIVWQCRMIKSPKEIEYLKKSAYANDRGFEAAVDAIKEGVTEKDVEIALMQGMTKYGARPDFLAISAGLNRYDMMNPYGSMEVVLQKGDMVILDYGCQYYHYFSDVTRGVFVGKPHPKAEELYKAVLDVHDHALSKAKPGNAISDIDAAAEKRVIELGYRDLMLHRTGHAFGLEVHECPSIGPSDHTILQPGMVLAIEPGLYDYNVGAFRIEDDILITESGYELLSNAPRNVIVK